jgi:hypothetical protein
VIIRRFWYLLTDSQWRRFFAKNGPRTWQDIRFTGFREPYDQPDVVCGQWVGVINDNSFYYINVTEDFSGLLPRRDPTEAKRNLLDAKMKATRTQIDTYLLPDCRCRAGLHWKCSVHGRWIS